MFPGQFTLCLNTKDLAGMRRFYEALGMKVHIDQPQFVLLNNGDVDIALMTFLDQPCLNFRGADVFELHEQAAAAGLVLEGTPQRYKQEQYNADADGMNWVEYDPDGNNVFFDTNEGEMGDKGDALALQRVLDATSKQLINVGASDACQNAFRTQVLEQFMRPERRAQTNLGLDTTPLTEPGQYVGNFNLCLKTKDNAASRTFYQALGLEVTGNNDDKWVRVGNGDCEINLMTFLGQSWLNCRGADVFKVYEQLSAAGLELEGEPTRYTSEEMGGPASGAHWNTKDPDGNVVYFDTTDPELIVPGESKAIETVLTGTQRNLRNIGADEDCMAAFQTEVLDRFTGSSAS
jgi:catechol 2,3-dioxygenase-like lactoylglutathione lyase family enzyme